ncbi:MAG: SbtA family thio(seleno)oxazole RiPP natural product precursor [Nitrospirota bacterium]
MDSKELKKILAGIGIATLLAGATIVGPGCASTAESS